VCAGGGPGVRTAVKRPVIDDVHETSALQPPTTKKPAAPSATAEHADKQVSEFHDVCLYCILLVTAAERVMQGDNDAVCPSLVRL